MAAQLSALAADAAELRAMSASLAGQLSRAAVAAEQADEQRSFGNELGAAGILAAADAEAASETTSVRMLRLRRAMYAADTAAGKVQAEVDALWLEVASQARELSSADARARAAELRAAEAKAERATALDCLSSARKAAAGVAEAAPTAEARAAEGGGAEAVTGDFKRLRRAARADLDVAASAARAALEARRARDLAAQLSARVGDLQPRGRGRRRDEEFWEAHDASEQARDRAEALREQLDEQMGQPKWHSAGRLHGYKLLVRDLPASWTRQQFADWVAGMQCAPDETNYPLPRRDGDFPDRHQAVLTYLDVGSARRAKRQLHDRVLADGAHPSQTKWFGTPR